MLIRRIRRVIGERARAVHEDLQPASYLMLAWLASDGPGAGRRRWSRTFDIDKGAVSRQVQHLVDLGLVERTPDPDDGRATLVAASDDAVAGWPTSPSTAASGSTSSSATGTTERARRLRRRRSSATTHALECLSGRAEPDARCRPAAAGASSGRRWRRTTSPAGSSTRVGAGS